MKKFFNLSSLLLCFCLFSIADRSEASELTQAICSKDTFYFKAESHAYESPHVNTVYRLELSKDTHRFRSYMIEYSSEFIEFLKSNNGKKLMEHTEKYNKVILEVLNERTGQELYMYSQIYLHQINYNYYKGLILGGLGKFGVQEDEADVILRVVEKCQKKFERVEKLFDMLLNLKKGYITKAMISESNLKKILQTEEMLFADDLVSVFKEEPLDIHYNKKIVLLNRFKTIRKSKLFFTKESYVTLIYTVFLPMQNKSYVENEPNCTPASTLPEFYTKH